MKTPRILPGSSNESLARSIADLLGVPAVNRILETFPDGERRIEIMDSVRGDDVYLLQSTGPPVERHLLELLLLVDACRRAGANRITAVVPYFGYARQDRRAGGRQAVGARLIADLIKGAGVDRVVAIDLHNPALESAFGVPLEHLSALPVLAEAARTELEGDPVVVAPDLGAAKLADRYADLLGLPVAIVHKTRVTGETVTVQRITGEVRGRNPIVVDDMISTAGTIVAAVNAVREAGGNAGTIVLATHALLVGPAIERIGGLALRRLIVSDSLAVEPRGLLPLRVVSVAPLLAKAITHLHEDRSLGELVARV